MKLEQLRAFALVADLRSFTAAARRLGCAQSTVSFHVAGLEESVGKPLLDRAGRDVRPTDAGRRLLPRARQILGLVEETRAEVTGHTPRLAVRLQASTIPATYLVPDAIACLRDEIPEADVTVLVSDSGTALAAVREGTCDFAVIGSAPSGPGVVAKTLTRDRILLVAPADRETSAFVLREPGSGTRAATERWIPGRGARIQVGSTEAVRRCVLAGLGAGFLSDRAVSEDLAAGRLRVVERPGLPVEREFHLVRPRGTRLSAVARALWTALLEVWGPAEEG